MLNSRPEGSSTALRRGTCVHEASADLFSCRGQIQGRRAAILGRLSKEESPSVDDGWAVEVPPITGLMAAPLACPSSMGASPSGSCLVFTRGGAAGDDCRTAARDSCPTGPARARSAPRILFIRVIRGRRLFCLTSEGAGEPAGAEGSLEVVASDGAVQVEDFPGEVEAGGELAFHCP